MKIIWNDEKTNVYNAVVWKNENECILDEYYTTKSEAVKAVKAVKKSYKGNGEHGGFPDCFVRYFDYQNDTTQDFNL